MPYMWFKVSLFPKTGDKNKKSIGNISKMFGRMFVSINGREHVMELLLLFTQLQQMSDYL